MQSKKKGSKATDTISKSGAKKTEDPLPPAMHMNEAAIASTDQDRQVLKLLKQYGVDDEDLTQILHGLRTISANCGPITKTEINITVHNVFHEFVDRFDDEVQKHATIKWRERVGSALISIAYGVLSNELFWLLLYRATNIASYASVKTRDSSRELAAQMQRLQNSMTEGLAWTDRRVLNYSINQYFGLKFTAEECRSRIDRDETLQAFFEDLEIESRKRGTEFHNSAGFDVRCLADTLIKFMLRAAHDHFRVGRDARRSSQ